MAISTESHIIIFDPVGGDEFGIVDLVTGLKYKDVSHATDPSDVQARLVEHKAAAAFIGIFDHRQYEEALPESAKQYGMARFIATALTDTAHKLSIPAAVIANDRWTLDLAHHGVEEGTMPVLLTEPREIQASLRNWLTGRTALRAVENSND